MKGWTLILTVTLAIFFSLSSAQSSEAQVDVRKSADGWSLQIDGRAFYINGVGCNTALGPNKENYLLMAKEMGANAVRTWGFTPRSYFDQAERYGLKVDAGVWFNPIRRNWTDSYQNASLCRRLKNETLAHVKEFKNHPALLLWNLGNEVFAHTEDKSERKAFGLFLKDLIDAVHLEDPNHPVVYSCAETADLPYLKTYVPNVDIVGVNTYGGFRATVQWLLENDFDKPLLATEFGCTGAWTQMKDVNDVPFDPFDQYKAKDYVRSWLEIKNAKSQSLGGFAFVLGEQPNQHSLTWWNINFGEEKRQAYWSMFNLFTGKHPQNVCPKIKTIKIDRVKNLRPGDQIILKVDAIDGDGDKLNYDFFVTDIGEDPLVLKPSHFFPVKINQISLQEVSISVPEEPGVYRVYAAVRDGHRNIAIGNRSIQVGPLKK